MTENLITEGLELMLFGMGTVLVFLTMLVFATSGMSALVMRFAPGEMPEAPPPAAAAPPADAALVAVISAAIHEHRRHRR